MKNKRRILVLVLLLVIGFASVSTTLVLNGIIGISNKKDDFKVIFTNASLDGIEKKEFIDSSTKQTLTYETNKLTTLEETTILEYEVTNTSRLYDASVSINCTVENNEYITMKYTPTNMIVASGETKTGSITTKLIKSSTEDKNIKVTCTLNAQATERESLGAEYVPPYVITFDSNGGEIIDTNIEVNNGGTYGELPTPTKGNFEFLGWYTENKEKVDSTTLVNIDSNHTLIAGWKNPNLIGYEISYDEDLDGIEDIGDKITIGTESFYVISHTDTELNALAKYNLKVGGIYNGITLESTISPSEEEYGRQNIQMRGWVGNEKRYGTVKFSIQKGWGLGTTIDVRNQTYGDGPIKDALYGENGYEDHIQKTISAASVRLITKEEIEVLINEGNELSTGQIDDKANSKGYLWLCYTSYWTQSALSDRDYSVWGVDSNGAFHGGDFDGAYHFGIRPVISIPLSH